MNDYLVQIKAALWAKRAFLTVLVIGSVGFYLEHSPIKNTVEGQTMIYLLKGLLALATGGTIS